ncbi:threonine ammonia-lyase [Parvularcula sp. LCG005]|uniref:threonine ammonia-lyase n=1 Tax=Parvularcula sp. LCG005 TaxID=3078805 RepID=UPI0029432068|nr:threonine ammonia-lyase [Parvularcula sp. LCG005]WOI53112.1 threonine ammonia-lyase [Parvularcula sp. LCG005]
MPLSSEVAPVAAPEAILGLDEGVFDDIVSKRDPAWSRIVETPCIHSPKLSAATGCDLFLKFDNFQYTGSFKERGALAKLLSLSEQERAVGVIAASAGNHAQGVARHAALLGIDATIVMPQFTPMVKVEQTRALGARVVLTGADYGEADAAAHKICSEEGLTFVHPFDDPYVCAGQGTVAAEMLATVPDLDTLIVPIGGGGLISGTAIVAKRINPNIRIIGVQAALFPGMLNAVKGGHRPCGGMTLAEGIAVREPGQLTRQVVSQLVDEIVTVEEPNLESALSMLLTIQKTLAEGAGAAGLAAVLAHPSLFRGRKVGSIICGGNIDTRLLSSILMRDLARQRRLARLRIELIDIPGQLTTVSEAISAAGGNVIDISYHRIFNDLPAKSTYIDISVEASDGLQMDRIIDSLRAAGLSVAPLTANQNQ